MTKEFVEKFAALITGAFSLLAALAWNDTVKTFINKYISPGSDLTSMFIYAITVSIIAVFVAIYLNKIVTRVAKREQKLMRKIENLEEKLEKEENKNSQKKNI